MYILVKQLAKSVIALLLMSSCKGEKSTDHTKELQPDSRPNILLIVADDMGYSDFEPFGGEIKTPNLQALANQGLILSNYYTAPTCSPARSMIFSGNDNHIAGMGNMGEVIPFTTNQQNQPGYEGYLNDRVIPFPMLLKDNGYHTYASGKWHLGHEEKQRPFYKGFEETFVLLDGAASHWDDQKKIYEKAHVRYSRNGEITTPPEGFYSTLGYTDKMLEFLDKNKGDGKPFFGYLAFTAPHDPLHVPDEWIDRYQGKYDEGYDKLREKRFKQLKEKGFIDEDIQLVEGLKSIPKWTDFSKDEKRTEAKRMEIYAAMVEYLDLQIGRVIDKLKKDGQYKNTLIIFISDNGANSKFMREYPSSSQAWVDSTFNNAYENLGKKGSGVATGPGWAQASMSPFKFFKTFTSEGGIKAPFIVSGYGVKEKGKINTQALVHGMDIAPTVLELARIEFPNIYSGNEIKPMQGKSITSILKGENNTVRTDHEYLGWELFGHRAIRKGDWKILWINDSLPKPKWELYNIKDDPSESTDISEKYPEKYKELIQDWKIYQEKNGVIIPIYKQ